VRRPLFDIGIHLRNVFQGFESEYRVNSTNYDEEIDRWLSSPTCRRTFFGMQHMVSSLAEKFIKERHSPVTVSVYVCGDNVRVKHALEKHLLSTIGDKSHLRFIKLKNEGVIRHGVWIQSIKTHSNNTGLSDEEPSNKKILLIYFITL
jgi:hypothetical protein